MSEAELEDEHENFKPQKGSDPHTEGNPSAVSAPIEIPSVEVLFLKTGETQRLHSFLLKIALLREGLRFDSIPHGSAYSAIQSLKVLSYEHVAISCPSEEISSPITLPSWPARVFSGDQPG